VSSTTAPPASAQSPVQPDNRPSGLSGETNGHVRPEALVGVEGDCRAARGAGPSLALMLAAARADGVALRPGDCYRPAANQSAAKSNACGKGNCACAAGTEATAAATTRATARTTTATGTTGTAGATAGTTRPRRHHAGRRALRHHAAPFG